MNSLPRPSRLARLFKRGAAFSLPETTMAVAIAALGLVSIMGLMPQGLETSRKIGNIAAQTRIIQDIIGDMQSTDWSLLDQYVNSSPYRMYDDQGVRLSGSDSQLTSYVAHVEFGDSFMPGVTSASKELYLRRLVVKIASTSKTSFDFSVSNSSRYKTISSLLPKIQ